VNELLIYGAPALTLGLGYFAAKITTIPDSTAYWRAIAKREEKKAAENYRKFVDACAECNSIENELLESNIRLADVMKAKTSRLDRIVEAFKNQKSGTAQKAVKLALGDA